MGEVMELKESVEQDAQRGGLQRRAATPTAGAPPSLPPSADNMQGLLLHLQRTVGNRAVNGLLQRWTDKATAQEQMKTPTPRRGPAVLPTTAVAVVQRDEDDAPTGAGAGSEASNAPADPVPAAQYVIPFDHNPLSAPGEKIIFQGVFTHPSPATYQLKYSSTGGAFDSDTGSASKTIAGLSSGNTFFFISKTWDGTSSVTVKLEVQRISDSQVVRTYDWTFAKKATLPSTIQQQESEDERALPGVYSYKVGPALHHEAGAAGPDYEHLTILETFGQNTCNITLDDLKPAFKQANPGITTPQQITEHFFGGSGNNGTFTMDHDDKIYDQHGGGIPDLATFTDALTTMKEITCDLPQTYEINTGVALGRYTIRRIMKVDGSKKLRKMKA
jgi:hypothetical protein